MNFKFRICGLSIACLFLVGCSGTLIPIADIHDENPDRGLTLEETTKAIKLGAATAGWNIEPISDNQIRAIYRIRKHQVTVMIDYSTDSYTIRYANSVHMKVKCGKQNDPTKPPQVTDGDHPCPGGVAPTFIHPKYSEWVQNLNNAIRGALTYS
jgi:hypothetical protein